MRRRQKEVGGSLDSLLDTMTNVVGILIILLIVTQLNVGEKVKEIRENLPDISPEQISESEAEEKKLSQRLQQLQNSLKNPKDAPKIDLKELDSLKAQLAKLQKELSKPIASPKLEKLSEQDIKKEEDKLSALKTKIEKDLEKLEKLNAQLASVPLKLPGPPAKVVKMPNPRAAPPGAKALRFYCTNNQLYPIDSDKLHKTFQAIFKTTHFKKDKSGKMLSQNVKDYFNKNNKGDTYFNIRMDHLRFTYHAAYFKLQAKDDKGFSTERLKKSNNPFELRLKKAARENKASLKKDKKEKWYIRFIVDGDSFDTYLVAREIAEENGFAIGWQPTTWKGFLLERHPLKLSLSDLQKPSSSGSSSSSKSKKPVDQID